MRRIERGLTLCQPAVLGAAIVFMRFAALPTTPASVLRPLAVVVAISMVALLLAYLVTRSWTWAPLVAGSLILVSLREFLPGLLLAVFALWWVGITVIRRVSSRPPPSRAIPHAVARATGVFGLALFLVMSWTAYEASVLTRPKEVRTTRHAVAGVGGPNIYVVLLDGYPRADTLRKTFRWSNEPFLADLRSLGFTISDEARANYNTSALTLASFFNAAYVGDLLAGQRVPDDAADQLRWLHALIERASVLDILSERGYVIRTIPSAFTSLALTSADDYVDDGHVNEFEAGLIWSSPWSAVFPDVVSSFLLEAHKRSVVDALDNAARAAEAGHRDSQFLFAHVLSPHTPFVLHPESQLPPEPPKCFPRSCGLWTTPIESLDMTFEKYREGFLPQLHQLNLLINDAVERIIAADPAAVIILMSDHGSRYSLADLPEHFRSFLAARVPHDTSPFAQNESTVNILPRLASLLFDVDVEVHPHRSWLSSWTTNFPLTPISVD